MLLSVALIEAIENNNVDKSLEIEGGLIILKDDAVTPEDFWIMLSESLSNNTYIEQIVLCDVPDSEAKHIIDIINNIVSASSKSKIRSITLENHSLEGLNLLLSPLLKFRATGNGYNSYIFALTDEIDIERKWDKSKVTGCLDEEFLQVISTQPIAILQITESTLKPSIDKDLLDKFYNVLCNKTYIKKIVLDNLSISTCNSLLALISRLLDDKNSKSGLRKLSLESYSINTLNSALSKLIEFNDRGQDFSVELSIFDDDKEKPPINVPSSLKVVPSVKVTSSLKATSASFLPPEWSLRPPSPVTPTISVAPLSEPRTLSFNEFAAVSQSTWSSSVRNVFFPSTKLALKNNMLDVSGYDNNCGLYALSLAARNAIDGVGPQHTAKIPIEVKNLTDYDVAPGSNGLEYYGNFLRKTLYNVLKADEVYKNLRKQTFINLCFTKNTALDAQSFAISNNEYINNLDDQIDFLQARLYSINDTSIDLNLRTEEVANFYADLKSFFIVDESSLATRLNEYLPQDAELSSAIKFINLFTTAWENVLESDAPPEDRQAIKELITKHIYNFLSNDLNKLDENSMEYLTRVKLFLKLLTLGDLGHKDTNENLRLLLCFCQVNKDWDMCYENYLNYVKNNCPMLTADELGAIAKAWAVKLTIEFPNKQTYISENIEYAVAVTLCNPNQNHWQVRLPEAVLAEIKIVPDF